MDHDRAFLLAVTVGVLQFKVQRQLEVELDGTALPGTAEAVGQVEVDLRAVERAVALVDSILHTHAVEGHAKAFGRKLPVLIGTHGVLGTGGKLDLEGEAELLVVVGDELRGLRDLFRDLVGADIQVRIVLGEGADTEQTVQGTSQLVAMVMAGLCETER